jgi:hypothetical protein
VFLHKLFNSLDAEWLLILQNFLSVDGGGAALKFAPEKGGLQSGDLPRT